MPENGKKVLTMAYIERDAVHDLVRSLTKYAWASPGNTGHRVTVDADDVDFGVDKIPSADVAPVRHGRWILDEKRYVIYCSECGEVSGYSLNLRDVREENHYCPNCGCKMDLEG